VANASHLVKMVGDSIHIHCQRDKRFSMRGGGSGKPGLLNRWLHRIIEALQCAVRRWLPNADIVFDRFHVMQMYSKALAQVRRALFKKADDEGKEMLKGSRYLILPN